MTAIETPQAAPPQTTAFDELGGSLRGELLLPTSPGSEPARRIWNGAIDRRPACIARCTGVADVVAAVRFAREHNLEIAVRGGGHNVAGTAVCDDGIVIDLSAMRAVRVDPADRRAWVQGGALWGDVDHETQAHGFATTGGIVSHTGVAGLTLGGGVGWLMRKHGLTVDNLLAVDVVSADGTLLRASEEEHPDLFWALRGGGGNFGVVTEFEFRLNPLGPTVLAGPIFWLIEDSPDVMRFYRDWIAEAPDDQFLLLARVAGALDLADQPGDLLAVHQQLSGAGGIGMDVGRCRSERRHVGAEELQLAFLDDHVRFLELDASGANRLHLPTFEREPGLEPFFDKIIVPRLAILDDAHLRTGAVRPVIQWRS